MIGIGDNVCDIYVDTGLMYPGGQALNVAVFARKLSIDSAYLGNFGSDIMGRHVQETLDSFQVKTDLCQVYDETNGFALVTHQDGERIFLGSNRGGPLKNHPIVLQEREKAYLSGFDLMHTSNNSHLDTQLAALATLPGKLSYDFSGSWRNSGRLQAVCPYADIVFMSLTPMEYTEVPSIAKKAHDLGTSLVLMTMGSEGACLSADGFLYRQLPHMVEAVDTLGAGDSFAAAFLTSVLEKLSYEEALNRAARFSAMCCLERGAFGNGKTLDKYYIDHLKKVASPPKDYFNKIDESEIANGN